MDALIKQTRRKNPASKQKTGEIKVPARKSVSFKEDKKKSANWLHKQFSKQMSDQSYDPISDQISYDLISDMDHAAAVAATAYAITTWLESYHSGLENGASFSKSKSRREDAFHDEPTSLSRRFSEAEMNDNKLPTPKSSVRKSTSVKKTPTFSINLRGDEHERQRKSVFEPPLKTQSKRHAPPPPPPPPPPSPPPLRLPPGEHTSRKYDNTADAWEKGELAKIKARYEKLNRKIDLWEAKKRDKARRKLEKTEEQHREQEQRRKRGLQRFREDTEYIKQIVAGARAQAEKQRQSEELKVKEKTNVIRSTGKLPGKACLCF